MPRDGGFAGGREGCAAAPGAAWPGAAARCVAGLLLPLQCSWSGVVGTVPDAVPGAFTFTVVLAQPSP